MEFIKNNQLNKNGLIKGSLLTLCMILFATQTIFAQKYKKVRGNGNLTTETRTVGEYDEIYVGGSFDVVLKAGAEGKITIEIEENLKQYLVSEVKDGRLKVKWKKGINVNTTKKGTVTIPIKEISELGLAGAGDISSTSVIETENFKVSLAGSGNMDIPVDVGSLKVNLAGSGNINIKGDAKSVNCSIAGSGNIKAGGLDSTSSDASISGSGDVHFGTTENLRARISGSGNVKFKGDPKQDVKISGSGNVRSH